MDIEIIFEPDMPPDQLAEMAAAAPRVSNLRNIGDLQKRK